MFKLLALTVKPVSAPDTRYRIFQYIDLFRKKNIEVTHLSLYNDYFYNIHNEESKTLIKLFSFIYYYAKRFLQMIFTASGYDAVWIGRELSPIGPPVLEKLLFKLNKTVILDIDDALFIPDETTDSFIHHRLRDFNKFKKISDRFCAIVCGSRYLYDYFSELNANVHLIPTVVDTSRYASVKRIYSETVRIGWIGTPRNIHHINLISNVLHQLDAKYDFEMIIVGLNQKPDWHIKKITCLDWHLKKELEYFACFDIGIMPLQDLEFVKGKCAFKAVQYMACAIPVVASPIGANNDLITDGVNGFLASSPKDWYDRLEKLLLDPVLRETIGKQGQETVTRRYSLHTTWAKYADIIREKET